MDREAALPQGRDGWEPPAGAAVELTRALVRFDTRNPPGDELPAIEYLEQRLRDAGFDTQVIPYRDEHARPGRAHLVARRRGSGSRPGLLFSGHVDVVPPGDLPWSVAPFGGDLRDGRVFGRGACDMKAGVAALVTAAEALARSGRPLEGDLVLALTADEERNCLGAEALAREPLFDGIGAVLVAEPTSLRVILGEKGALWVAVEARGRTAHGSMPHLGQNAVAGMVDLLSRWQAHVESRPERHSLLGSPSLTIGSIRGGVKINVVPDQCTAELDMRTVPGQDHGRLLQELDEMAHEVQASRPGLAFSRTVLSDRAPVECPADSDLCRALQRALEGTPSGGLPPAGVPYCTEACIWSPVLGIPAVICGPGAPGMAHQPDEHAEAAEIEEAARVFTRAGALLLHAG